MTLEPRRRMPAAERRASIVEAATRCFAERGFAGTTTARVAARAEVTEAVLFRHVRTKRELYLLCVDESWDRLRHRVDALTTTEARSVYWRLPGRVFFDMVTETPHVTQLWMRCLVDVTGDQVIDEHISSKLRDVHAYVVAMVRTSEEAGGVPDRHDPDVAAWTIISIGLLGASLAARGLATSETIDSIVLAHREWLSGSVADDPVTDRADRRDDAPSE